MENEEKTPPAWKFWCFWIAVVVVVVGFLIPVENKTVIDRDGVEVTFSRTLYDIVVGNKTKMDVYVDGVKQRRH